VNNLPLKLRVLAMLSSHAQPFRVVCADPPWKHADQLPGDTRGASKNYPLLTVDEICTREFIGAEVLDNVDDNALLILWALASMPYEALDVCRAWGFEPKSEVIWNKITPTGKPFFGMGRTVRGSHEKAIIAVRGRAALCVDSKSVRSTFEATVPRWRNPKTGKLGYAHSVKPERFYTSIVEKISNGPYVEMFARDRSVPVIDDCAVARCDRWSYVGNEVA
jgi:N6-adenosine-specific RNA methylase IME4